MTMLVFTKLVSTHCYDLHFMEDQIATTATATVTTIIVAIIIAATALTRFKIMFCNCRTDSRTGCSQTLPSHGHSSCSSCACCSWPSAKRYNCRFSAHAAARFVVLMIQLLNTSILWPKLREHVSRLSLPACRQKCKHNARSAVHAETKF